MESEKGPSATPTAGGSGVASQGRGHAFDQEEPLKDSARGRVAGGIRKKSIMLYFSLHEAGLLVGLEAQPPSRRGTAGPAWALGVAWKRAETARRPQDRHPGKGVGCRGRREGPPLQPQGTVWEREGSESAEASSSPVPLTASLPAV